MCVALAASVACRHHHLNHGYLGSVIQLLIAPSSRRPAILLSVPTTSPRAGLRIVSSSSVNFSVISLPQILGHKTSDQGSRVDSPPSLRHLVALLPRYPVADSTPMSESSHSESSVIPVILLVQLRHHLVAQSSRCPVAQSARCPSSTQEQVFA